jgi:hypothetical protein
MPPARYGLRSENRMPALLRWAEMDGFFVGQESAWDGYESPTEEPGTVQVTVRGVEWLDAAADRPTRTLELGDTVLEVLHEQGRTLGDYALWDTRLTVPSGAAQASLTASIGTLPHAGAQWAWDQWRAGRPASPNLWAALPVGQREGWLEVTQIIALREHSTPYPALTEQIDLDGNHIDDLASLFCALGDAVAGPGGWCASSVGGLADLLQYAPRAAARPRLVWHGLAAGDRALARPVEADGRTVTYFEMITGVLADGSVELIAA